MTRDCGMQRQDAMRPSPANVVEVADDFELLQVDLIYVS